MKKLRLVIVTLGLMVAGGMLLTPVSVQAAPADEIKGGVDSIGGAGENLEPQIQTITNILLFVLGAIAVVMIVIGGIRYATSNGDSSNIKAAKDTILYAVVGLIVAILAYAIVNFIVSAF